MLLNRLQTVHTTCILMLVLLETSAKFLEVKVSIPIDLAHLPYGVLAWLDPSVSSAFLPCLCLLLCSCFIELDFLQTNMFKPTCLIGPLACHVSLPLCLFCLFCFMNECLVYHFLTGMSDWCWPVPVQWYESAIGGKNVY